MRTSPLMEVENKSPSGDWRGAASPSPALRLWPALLHCSALLCCSGLLTVNWSSDSNIHVSGHVLLLVGLRPWDARRLSYISVSWMLVFHSWMFFERFGIFQPRISYDHLRDEYGNCLRLVQYGAGRCSSKPLKRSAIHRQWESTKTQNYLTNGSQRLPLSTPMTLGMELHWLDILTNPILRPKSLEAKVGCTSN